MKKILALFVTLLTALTLSVSATAETETADFNWTYAVKNDGTAVVTGYTGLLWGDVEIPSEIDGYTVTEIGEYCFKNNSASFALTIPGTIKTIPEKTFEYCYGLSEITFSEGVEVIEDYAFNYCSGLQEINFPNSLRIIGNYAFTECSYLEKIVLPDTVTDIRVGAFSYCSNLRSADLGNGMAEIPNYAFYNCYSLEEVVIGKTVKRISYNAFNDCNDIKRVYYRGTRSEWNDIPKGSSYEIKDAYIIFNVTDEYLEEHFMKEPDKSTEYIMIAIYSVIVLALVTVTVILILCKKKTCPNCGAVPEEGEKFCVKCGTKLY